MLSNNQIKVLSSLKTKKYRDIHQKFLAEGEKIVHDILLSPSKLFRIQNLIASPDFLNSLPASGLKSVPEITEASPAILQKISSLKTPNKAILVCEIPDYQPDFVSISKGYSLYLDDIRDPGNLGTIMRTANWFGMHHIFCSTESVDVYNPKVIQSTMGAICTVKVYYMEREALLTKMEKIEDYALIGTLLEGENIFTSKLPGKGMIVLGNESKGISDVLIPRLAFKIHIPASSAAREHSESLNVASAAAIVMAELSRKSESYSK